MQLIEELAKVTKIGSDRNQELENIFQGLDKLGV